MALSSGTRLGPYELLAPVGAGGMGEVYRAKDTRLDRTVAVKVLPAHLSASAESRQRFEREAKTISRLSHPRICALYDVGNQDGVEFLVMEYLEGETLHRQGIVHREVGSRLETGHPQPLFELRLSDALTPFRRKYDIFPDGERFLVIRRATEGDPDTVAVALHWTGMLRKR